MAKDLPSFIAQEGAKREGSIIREKNFVFFRLFVPS